MTTLRLSTEKFEILSKSVLEQYLNDSPITELYERKRYYDDLYYNTGNNSLDDFRYDMLKDAIMLRDTNYNTEIGAKLRDEEIETPLPYYLGSMDKVKPDQKKILDKWVANNTDTTKQCSSSDISISGESVSRRYVIMDKLDGISCLLCTRNNKVSLYTRADGTTGKDISYIKPFINYIPNNIPNNMNIRGELVMSKNNFEQLPGGKINPRNTVSGAVKAKTFRESLYNVDFVAYENIEDCIEQEKLTDQLNFLDKLGFRTVKRQIINDISIDILASKLEEYRETGHYEIDGIIVHKYTSYVRNTDKNPNYAIAFKKDLIVNAEVIDVTWNITRRGFLKPVVIIKPVNLCGATLRKATGYNAWFIQENKIGPGATIELVRSGDVIPKIIDVIKESPTGPKMPIDGYIWTDTHVDIIANDPGLVARIKTISYFMSTMKIKHVSDATVRRIVEYDYNTIGKILRMTIQDFENIDRFGKKLAERTYNSIHDSLQNIDLSTLMTASSCFELGIGIKRMKVINQKIPNIIEISEHLSNMSFVVLDKNNFYNDMKERNDNGDYDSVIDIYNQIIKIEGFSDKMTVKIILGLPKFYKFFNKIKNFITLKEPGQYANNDGGFTQIFKGEKIVCSGFREILDNDIMMRGGELVNSVSKKTFCVVVKDHTENPTGKVKKAIGYNIPVYNINEFRDKYNL